MRPVSRPSHGYSYGNHESPTRNYTSTLQDYTENWQIIQNQSSIYEIKSYFKISIIKSEME